MWSIYLSLILVKELPSDLLANPLYAEEYDR